MPAVGDIKTNHWALFKSIKATIPFHTHYNTENKHVKFNELFYKCELTHKNKHLFMQKVLADRGNKMKGYFRFEGYRTRWFRHICIPLANLHLSKSQATTKLFANKEITGYSANLIQEYSTANLKTKQWQLQRPTAPPTAQDHKSKSPTLTVTVPPCRVTKSIY